MFKKFKLGRTIMKLKQRSAGLTLAKKWLTKLTNLHVGTSITLRAKRYCTLDLGYSHSYRIGSSVYRVLAITRQLS